MQNLFNQEKLKSSVIPLIILTSMVIAMPSYAEDSLELKNQKSSEKIESKTVSENNLPKTDTGSQAQNSKDIAVDVRPLTQAEIRQGLQNMHQRLISSIEIWGNSLKPEDFERSWRGRLLNKTKRQEVCGIYQKIVNDTYQLALTNKARLSLQDQKVLADRNVFIQNLGFKGNIVDTQMGFNCRIK